MTKTIHKAETRGFADHGWLKSRHTFSFAHYHNPERMNFGALRVLNDDVVAPGMGFGTHPHADMEIVSIPITGSLAHKDSTGTAEIIRSGDVQIMSAGTGLTHSEFNPDKASEVNFLQIWVLPEKRGISPRYEQKTFDLESSRNSFVLLVSPERTQGSLWINQQARFWQGVFDKGVNAKLDLAYGGTGLYLFVISGSVSVADETLKARDAIGLTGTATITVEALDACRLLAIEVPV
ncbi:MAG: pirin family protein [Spirochaetota bacterium]